MVLYFTATGNSLYVAKKLDENPISIPQMLKHNSLDFTDESIGIVFPIYAGRPPKIIVDFLSKAKFNTDYLYFVGTYGNSDSAICKTLPDVCKKLGINIDYINTVSMVDNYLPAFDMEQEKKLDKKVDEKVNEILADLSVKKKYIPTPTAQGLKLAKGVWTMEKLKLMVNDGSQLVIKTDKCTGCGICKQVCPVDNIVIGNGVAVRKNAECEYCLACAHNCPQKAITIKRGEKNPNARYRNESITLQEIIASNNQSK
ncbi:MAG: 4Fe-4S dicluster domain-containing protein [Clostridium sp.]|nr:4Fe-4S dicluster domain-containing protein [Clostridium sp.]